MLEVRALSRPGLAPVDLDLAAGEALALLGPSGSGKTLLLRAIADLDPNQGRVALDGEDREAMPAPTWRRRVTYLSAEPGWWAERAGEHFPDAEGAKALLPPLGLPEDIMARPIAELSTGERHRLALVRVEALQIGCGRAGALGERPLLRFLESRAFVEFDPVHERQDSRSGAEGKGFVPDMFAKSPVPARDFIRPRLAPPGNRAIVLRDGSNQ